MCSSISDHPVLPVDDRHPLSPAESSMAACQSRQATSDKETLDGRNAVIERTNPNWGAMSGGPEIWISGSIFPTAKTPLYPRFRDNFACVVGVTLPSLGQYLMTPRLFKNLICSRAICRKLMFQVPGSRSLPQSQFQRSCCGYKFILIPIRYRPQRDVSFDVTLLVAVTSSS